MGAENGHSLMGAGPRKAILCATLKKPASVIDKWVIKVTFTCLITDYQFEPKWLIKLYVSKGFKVTLTIYTYLDTADSKLGPNTTFPNLSFVVFLSASM
jgi:hypothetical protein